jgi:uncharacterized Fe-S cluster-containing radical SAM superfamily enzyme
MELDAFRKVFEGQAELLLLLMLWNQGEPFINKNLTNMIRVASAHNVPTITSTNVHYIRSREDAEEIVNSGLDEIIVSLDGVTPESYLEYRVGGNFDRAPTIRSFTCSSSFSNITSPKSTRPGSLPPT